MSAVLISARLVWPSATQRVTAGRMPYIWPLTVIVSRGCRRGGVLEPLTMMSRQSSSWDRMGSGTA